MKIWRGLIILTVGLILIIWSVHLNNAIGQDDPVPEEGNWSGIAIYGGPDTPIEVQMAFVVEDGMVAHGAVALMFAFPNMPDEMLTVMLEEGCIARFEDISLETSSVRGTFVAEDAAVGIFSIDACELGEFGVQLLTAPLEGEWEVVPGDPDEMRLIEETITLAAATTQLGADELYEFRCAACHGSDGEGTEVAPPLNDYIVLPADYIESRVRSGQEAMSAFSEEEIAPDQLEVLITHIQNNIVNMGVPEFDAEELKSTHELRQLHCTECHGSLGQGKNDFGPPLNIWPPYSITGVIEGARLPLPGMPRLTVTNEELVLIAGYMQSWAAEDE